MLLKDAIILALDDNPDILALLEGWLKPACKEFHTAESAQTALPQFENHKPNLVLVDISMPGPNGLVAMRKMQQHARSMQIQAKFCILSARNTREDFDAAITYGADGYVLKPINKEDLFGRIEKLLAES